MNAIGEIGNFIITYQRPIQAIVIFGCFLLGIICIGKAICHENRKRRMLSQIHEAVLDMNETVKRLGEKKSEIVYIDRSPGFDGEKEASIVSGLQKEAPKTERAIENIKDEPAVEEPARRYFSRDCATSKNGRKYTREELDAQIRD